MDEIYEELTKSAVNPAEVNERASKIISEKCAKLKETKELDEKIKHTIEILDIVAIVKQLQTASELAHYQENKSEYQEALVAEKNQIKESFNNGNKLSIARAEDSRERKIKNCDGIINLLIHSIDKIVSNHMRLASMSDKELKTSYGYIYSCQAIYQQLISELENENFTSSKVMQEESKIETKNALGGDHTKLDISYEFQNEEMYHRLPQNDLPEYRNHLQNADLLMQNIIQRKKAYREPADTLKVDQISYSKYDQNTVKESTIVNEKGEKISIKRLGRLNFLAYETAYKIDKDIFYYDITKFDEWGLRKSKYEVFSGEIIQEGIKLENSYDHYTPYLKLLANSLLSEENLRDSVVRYNQYLGDLCFQGNDIKIKRFPYKEKVIEIAKQRGMILASYRNTNRII